jgi:hypothetical protein
MEESSLLTISYVSRDGSAWSLGGAFLASNPGPPAPEFAHTEV